MQSEIIFHESVTIFNLVMMGLMGFLILFSIFYAVWTWILSFFPKSRKKIFVDFEWGKVPYQAGFLLLILMPVCAFGFWWGATRISTIKVVDRHEVVILGIFGNSLARFEGTDIEKIEVNGRTHKTGYASTYKLEIFAKGKSYATFGLLWKEMDSLRTKLRNLQDPKKDGASDPSEKMKRLIKN